ncbi:MAG: hypothetical protein R3E96_12270 [Planctomycetota bacterium]
MAVFVTGDEEYRSEESMPMLAAMLERDFGMRVTVLFAENEAGEIAPNHLTNIRGLEVLRQADLMVLFTRFRALPPEQLRAILDYAESGKPMVGFRTATHALLYKNGPRPVGTTVFPCSTSVRSGSPPRARVADRCAAHRWGNAPDPERRRGVPCAVLVVPRERRWGFLAGGRRAAAARRFEEFEPQR